MTAAHTLRAAGTWVDRSHRVCLDHAQGRRSIVSKNLAALHPNYESDLWIGNILEPSCGTPITHNDDVVSFDLCHAFGGFDEPPVKTAQGVDSERNPRRTRVTVRSLIVYVPLLHLPGAKVAFLARGGRHGGEGSGLVDESAQGDKRAPVLYQIEYEDELGAASAVDCFDNAEPWGRLLQVAQSTEKPQMIEVTGIPRRIEQSEVQEHFSKTGEVANVEALDDDLFGKVAFRTADDAWEAKVRVDGTELAGRRLRVEFDVNDESLRKLFVHGIRPGVSPKALNLHFGGKAEGVSFASVHGGYEVRVHYKEVLSAKGAIQHLRGKTLEGEAVSWGRIMDVDWPWDATMGAAEVRVRNLDSGKTEEQVARRFGEIGEVLLVEKRSGELPFEFCE